MPSLKIKKTKTRKVNSKMAKAATENTGLSKRTKTILISAAGGLTTYGVVLGLQDDDEIGTDDEVANALQITGDVFRRVAAGKLGGRDTILKAVADGIYIQLGLEPVEDEE